MAAALFHRELEMLVEVDRYRLKKHKSFLVTFTKLGSLSSFQVFLSYLCNQCIWYRLVEANKEIHLSKM